MAQDVRQYGTAEYAAGPEPQPDSSGAERQHSLRSTMTLLIPLVLLAALIVGVVLYVAPWASAAGSCGGG